MLAPAVVSGGHQLAHGIERCSYEHAKGEKSSCLAARANHELLGRRRVAILQPSAGGLLAGRAAGRGLCLSSPICPCSRSIPFNHLWAALSSSTVGPETHRELLWAPDVCAVAWRLMLPVVNADKVLNTSDVV